MAAPTDRNGDGTRVPVQSNSSMYPRPKPCDMTVGCVSFCRVDGVQRNPQPFGAQSHLWQFPVYQSAPRLFKSTATCPGPCAPSTSTGTATSWHAAMIRSNGTHSALAEVM